MPIPGSMEEIRGYQSGNIMDRLGMMSRRAMLLKQQQRQQQQQAMPSPVRQASRPVQPPPEQQPTNGQSPSGEGGKVDRWAEVAARLWAKAIPAEVEVAPGVKSYARPGEGIISYGDIPTSVTSKIKIDKPVLGWDPNSLEPDEKFLLNYLVSMRQKERAQNNHEFANDPNVQQRIDRGNAQ